MTFSINNKLPITDYITADQAKKEDLEGAAVYVDTLEICLNGEPLPLKLSKKGGEYQVFSTF